MKKVTVLVLAATALLTVVVRADEMTDLKAKVDAQDKEIAQLKDKVGQLDKKAESSGLPDSLKWAENISWFGDFRYRHEGIDDKGRSADPSYSRNRIRARVSIKATISDEILFGMRLATGSSDPKSGNQTLGDAWSGKAIWIDRAYLAYLPQTLPGFSVGIGKEQLPYYRAGGNQIIWDDDVNPEGIHAAYTGKITSTTKFTATAGGFWVVERNGSSSVDSGMFGIQGLVEQEVMDASKIVGGASYFDFTNLQGQSALYSAWNTGTPKFFGNDNAGGVYLMDYRLLELFLAWESALGSMPYSVFGSWVQNTDAVAHTVTGDKEDTGYIVGATLNKAKKQWDWQLAYDYRQVKADAVVGEYTDSDFFGGNTGGKGHRVSGVLQLQKNTQLAATFFVDNKYDASFGSTKAGKKYNRMQIDLKVKFK